MVGTSKVSFQEDKHGVVSRISDNSKESKRADIWDLMFPMISVKSGFKILKVFPLSCRKILSLEIS